MSGNKAFGELIRKRREEKKQVDPRFSLRQFAKRVQLSPTFVSKLENGDFAPPSAEKIKLIAHELDLNPDDLLAMAKKMDPAIEEIIHEQNAMADFLRSASGLSEEKLRELTEQAKRMKREDDA